MEKRKTRTALGEMEYKVEGAGEEEIDRSRSAREEAVHIHGECVFSSSATATFSFSDSSPSLSITNLTISSCFRSRFPSRRKKRKTSN